MSRPTRVRITCRGVYHDRVGTLITTDMTKQFHRVQLDGDDRPRAFRPDEYTRIPR